MVCVGVSVELSCASFPYMGQTLSIDLRCASFPYMGQIRNHAARSISRSHLSSEHTQPRICKQMPGTMHTNSQSARLPSEGSERP